MSPITGFVRGTRYTSVPNALLGPLLAEIDTLPELKCTLRVLGVIYQRRGQQPWVTLEELQADRALVDGLAHEDGGAKEAMGHGIRRAVERGTLFEVRRQGEGAEETFIFVNDEQGRRAAQRLDPEAKASSLLEPSSSEGQAEPRPDIFTLYEENIGPLTPLLCEELREAEATYPWTWVEQAFREAVELQRRNWRYISRILERWAREGKDNGKPGRYSKAADPKEYLRRYGNLSR